MKKILSLFVVLFCTSCENGVFDRQSAQNAPVLTDIDWRYVGAGNHCMDWSPDMRKVDFTNGPSLRFFTDSTISGKAHVNRYGGRYSATTEPESREMVLSGRLSVKGMYMTEMGGPRELMEQEKFLLQSLNNAFRYSVITYTPDYDYLAVDYTDKNASTTCGLYLYFARKK